MSEHDSEDSQSRGETNNESRCPHYSQVDSTLDITPQMSYISPELDSESLTATDLYAPCSQSRRFDITTTNFSVDQNTTRRGFLDDNSISGPALKTGMATVCGAPMVETGPKNKGGKFLKPPIHTTPHRSNAWSPSGGVELEGTKMFTLLKCIFKKDILQ